jgi:anhydro-N-acetylmuramic acid kinase
MKVYKAIGLMSGTSLDGIDAALIETDGERHVQRLGFITIPYDDTFRAKLRQFFGLKPQDRAKVAAVERELTERHAEAVRQLLQQTGASKIDLVGFHGQTISHDPAAGYTIQIGDGALLAQMTGIPVVNDFRTADVAAGGHGAPLVPVYHRAIAAPLNLPVAILNIGGVANVTYIGVDGKMLAFDTGPGNALIDDWMLQKTGEKYDAAGRLATTGTVDEAVLQKLMAHDYFKKPAPKSLDRNAFHADVYHHLSAENGAATLAAFTADAVGAALALLPQKPATWVVCGGGRLNKFIMRRLKSVTGAHVAQIDEMGINGDAVEAEAFAYLAVRSFLGLPISFPGTTGVKHDMVGGVLHLVPDKKAGFA